MLLYSCIRGHHSRLMAGEVQVSYNGYNGLFCLEQFTVRESWVKPDKYWKFLFVLCSQNHHLSVNRVCHWSCSKVYWCDTRCRGQQFTHVSVSLVCIHSIWAMRFHVWVVCLHFLWYFLFLSQRSVHVWPHPHCFWDRRNQTLCVSVWWGPIWGRACEIVKTCFTIVTVMLQLFNFIITELVSSLQSQSHNS